ncbi:hypothetical protein OOK47_42370 [Streptomyces sp. NBC_00268]|nr:hypothetical protein [Streptomyces sp. NBC_00268]
MAPVHEVSTPGACGCTVISASAFYSGGSTAAVVNGLEWKPSSAALGFAKGYAEMSKPAITTTVHTEGTP